MNLKWISHKMHKKDSTFCAHEDQVPGKYLTCQYAYSVNRFPARTLNLSSHSVNKLTKNSPTKTLPTYELRLQDSVHNCAWLFCAYLPVGLHQVRGWEMLLDIMSSKKAMD